MIDRTAFLADAQRLVARLEKDLRARCDDMPEVGSAVEAEYRKAKDAGRTGQAFEEWRADAITQQAVAWVLSCVFVRFLEDNRLIDPPRISGPVPLEGEKGENRLGRARDEHELYFQRHPGSEFTDREYLLAIFDDLAGRPGTRDLFGPHNPIRAIPNWLSPDAAKDELVSGKQSQTIFRKLGDDGRLVHDFTDPSLDTRFLGDLYQDLSEAARKKYALLQTPVFVEEFILDRTLTPAVETFGLEKVKLIDPAAGSGHFLLGAFARLLDAWVRREPATPRRELVRRALDAVHGVDLNPYAVAVARFRLLLTAWRECAVLSLANAPEFRLNLACGDSLLHGSTKAVQGTLGFTIMAHTYQPEDAEELERLLRPGTYHAVVANPPYITPKDRSLNEKYRERYSACHMKYSLSVPFMQRIFDLACEGGYSGQITANSFMKREFGKKVIQEFIPTIDLTHVVDSSGAYIPGHGTPTVILFGRHRNPAADAIRTVMSIRGEPKTPVDPARGQVWTAILDQIDQPGSQSAFISVGDSPRDNFHRHPWSIGGGGIAELKEQLDEAGGTKVELVAEAIGITSVTGEDELYMQPREALRRRKVEHTRSLVEGDVVRDWVVDRPDSAIWLYDPKLTLLPLDELPSTCRLMWPYRAAISRRKRFGTPMLERGLTWYEWQELYTEKLRTPRSIVFAAVATHNHFAFEDGSRVFKQSAIVIKLPPSTPDAGYHALLGYLNSSTVCFWLKQECYPKERATGDISTDKMKPEANRYDMGATAVGRCPLPGPIDSPKYQLVAEIARLIHQEGRDMMACRPESVLARWETASGYLPGLLQQAEEKHRRHRERMVALQEELDWEAYRLCGLSGEGASLEVVRDSTVSIQPELRPFAWAADQPPDGLTPTLSALYLRRRTVHIQSQDLSLLEHPVFKRPWWGRQGIYGRLPRDYPGWTAEALHHWLLDRLESYFDLDGRMNDQGTPTAQVELSLVSTTKLADTAGRDPAFQAVAELYRGRPDFDVAKLVTELVEAESVPLMPVLRYKPSGLDKRKAWERTWELQRREDAIDARATKEGIGVNDGGWTPASDDGVSPLNKAQAKVLKRDTIGPIPAPPKYKSTDFQKADYWRLRGGLDVPKERWVIFPHCEGGDGLPLVAWAGYDHLQLAKAIAAHYVRVQEQEGGRDDPRLVPLLACLAELLPWLEQWHNEYDAEYGVAMGDYYEGFVQDEARQTGRTIEQVRAWQPPARPARGRGRKTTGQQG